MSRLELIWRCKYTSFIRSDWTWLNEQGDAHTNVRMWQYTIPSPSPPYTCIHGHARTHAHARARAHTHTHTHIQTDTHTHIWTLIVVFLFFIIFFQANLGVASLCKPASNNYTFGGVFQNCTSTSAGLCDRFRLNQKNPLTGTSMCMRSCGLIGKHNRQCFTAFYGIQLLVLELSRAMFHSSFSSFFPNSLLFWTLQYFQLTEC